jgi:hypothetical protein
VSRTRVIVLASFVAVSAAVAVVTVTVLRNRDGETTALPACARPGVTIGRPGLQFPQRFPFPAGTVFTEVFRNRATRGMPTVAGRMPLDLDEATRFFDDELPQAGFRVFLRQHRRGETGGYYDVTGFSGRFQVKTLPGCRGATSFSVSSRPTLYGRNPHSE